VKIRVQLMVALLTAAPTFSSTVAYVDCFSYSSDGPDHAGGQITRQDNGVIIWNYGANSGPNLTGGVDSGCDGYCNSSYLISNGEFTGYVGCSSPQTATSATWTNTASDQVNAVSNIYGAPVDQYVYDIHWCDGANPPYHDGYIGGSCRSQ
jgi:hypothetical protein